MHMQAPTLTTTRRPPLFVVVGALAIAAIASANAMTASGGRRVVVSVGACMCIPASWLRVVQ